MPWFLKLAIVVAVAWSGIFSVSYVYWEIKRKNYHGAFISIIPAILMFVSFYYFVVENLEQMI